MRISSFAQVCFGALVAAGAIAVACGGDNSPTASSGSSGTAVTGTAGTATGTSGTATGTSGTATGTSGTVSDAGSTVGGDGGGICPSTLVDKTTPCTLGVDPSCTKGCGPLLPTGSAQKNLGNKVCTCGTAGVYTCAACIYEAPLPGCYVVPAAPATCGAAVADKAVCTTACVDPGTGNDVCALTSDAGKAEGCVCITGASGPVYTCATLPW